MRQAIASNAPQVRGASRRTPVPVPTSLPSGGRQRRLVGIGHWVDLNPSTALKLLRPLAEQGNATAQIYLGQMTR